VRGKKLEYTYADEEGADIDIFNEVFEFPLLKMAQEYARHRDDKGDSWKTMNPAQLRNLFYHEIAEYNQAPRGTLAEYHELIDIINIGLMLLERLESARLNLDSGETT